MKLSPEYREMLVKEIAYARNRMGKETNVMRKIFFYGGAYGAINRVLNIEFNPQLHFMSFVVGNSYSMIANFFVEEHAFELPDKFFDYLYKYLEQLEVKIKNGEDTYSILEKIINLSTLTEGNTYYLYEKGVLKISD